MSLMFRRSEDTGVKIIANTASWISIRESKFRHFIHQHHLPGEGGDWDLRSTVTWYRLILGQIQNSIIILYTLIFVQWACHPKGKHSGHISSIPHTFISASGVR